MKLILVICLIFSNFYLNITALDNNGYTTESGIVIKPVLSTSLIHDDNLFSQSNTESSSEIFIVAPSVNFSLNQGVNQYDIDFSLESGSIKGNNDDNYLNGNIQLAAHLEPSSISMWDFSLMSGKATEARGSGITEGQANTFDEPLKFQEYRTRINYQYGNLSSFGRLAFDVEYYDKNYINFKELTNSQSYDLLTLSPTFFYSTNSRTNIFISYEQSFIKYDEFIDFSLDSTDSNTSIGFNWRSTAQTEGELRVGYNQKTFDNANRDDFSGLSWTFTTNWRPLSYSDFTFSSSRNIREPDSFVGDYIDEVLNAVSWRHRWNDRLNTSISTSHSREEYSGIDREDKSYSMRVQVDYAMRRWLDIAVFMQIDDNKSSDPNVVFEKNIVGIQLTMGF